MPYATGRGPMSTKREGYISWSEFYMMTAVVAAHRSKDPHTQVGACVAGSDNRILSVGYNGAPAGYDDDEFPWGVDEDPKRDKHWYVCHAEANAILNYRGSLKDLRDATVYVTLFPCNECAKLLAQVGVGKVVYLSDMYEGTDGNVISKDILDHAGIAYERMASTKRIEIVDEEKMLDDMWEDAVRNGEADKG